MKRSHFQNEMKKRSKPVIALCSFWRTQLFINTDKKKTKTTGSWIARTLESLDHDTFVTLFSSVQISNFYLHTERLVSVFFFWFRSFFSQSAFRKRVIYFCLSYEIRVSWARSSRLGRWCSSPAFCWFLVLCSLCLDADCVSQWFSFFLFQSIFHVSIDLQKNHSHLNTNQYY